MNLNSIAYVVNHAVRSNTQVTIRTDCVSLNSDLITTREAILIDTTKGEHMDESSAINLV